KNRRGTCPPPFLFPRSLPPSRLPVGLPSLPVRVRPPSSVPFSAWIALWASPPELISTNPKPRGRPVNLSVITLADSTVPCAANISCSWPSVTEYGRPPTYNFLPMFPSYVRQLMSLTLRSCPHIPAEDGQLKRLEPRSGRVSL